MSQSVTVTVAVSESDCQWMMQARADWQLCAWAAALGCTLLAGSVTATGSGRRHRRRGPGGRGVPAPRTNFEVQRVLLVDPSRPGGCLCDPGPVLLAAHWQGSSSLGQPLFSL